MWEGPVFPPKGVLGGGWDALNQGFNADTTTNEHIRELPLVGVFEIQGCDLDHVSFKVLSKNQISASQSILVRPNSGYRQEGSGRHSAAQRLFVLSVSLTIGEYRIPTGDTSIREANSVLGDGQRGKVSPD